MDNKKIILITILVIAAVGFAALFIFKNFKSNNALPSETVNSSENLNQTLLENKSQNGNEGAQKLPPLPDLNRVVINANLSSDAKTKLGVEIKEVSQAIKGNPDYAEAWLQLGILRKNAGDFEGAAEAWIYITLIRPTNYVAFSNLGDLYRSYIKDYQLAEKYWLKAVAIKPDFIQGYINLSDMYRYSYKEKANQAPEILKTGIEKNPKSAYLAVYLGSYYQDVGDKTNAKKYFEMALQIDPNNRGANDGLNSL